MSLTHVIIIFVVLILPLFHFISLFCILALEGKGIQRH